MKLEISCIIVILEIVNLLGILKEINQSIEIVDYLEIINLNLLIG